MQPLTASQSPLAEGVRPLLQTDLGQDELVCSSRPTGSKAQAGGLFMLLPTRPAAQGRIANKTSEQRFSQMSVGSGNLISSKISRPDL